MHSTDKGADGREIGAQAESYWLRVVPWAFYKLLKYVDTRYSPSDVVITENGVSVPKEQDMPVAKAVRDGFRLQYYKGYLDNLCKAIAEGVKVCGWQGRSVEGGAGQGLPGRCVRCTTRVHTCGCTRV